MPPKPRDKFGKPVQFPGRQAIRRRLREHASAGGGGLILDSRPGDGCTTLLTDISDHIAEEVPSVFPFHFSLTRADRDAKAAAARFASEFIIEAVRRRRRISGNDAGPLDIREALQFAAPGDQQWTRRVADRLADASLDLQLAAPLVAAAEGSWSFVIFDGLHNAAYIEGGDRFIASLLHVTKAFEFPFVLAGRRRAVSTIAGFDRLALDFSPADAARFARELGTFYGHPVGDAEADLLAEITGGRAFYIDAMVRRAAADQIPLSSFPGVARVFAEQIFSGEVGRWIGSEIEPALRPESASRFVSALADHIRSQRGLIPTASFRHAAAIGEEEFETALPKLDTSEIVRWTSGRIEPMTDDTVLPAYIESRSRLETAGEPRARVFASTLSAALRRTPTAMAARYRAGTSIGLKGLLMLFDGREVPAAIFDPARFDELYKGTDPARSAAEMADDPAKFKLPTAVFAAHTAEVYPPIAAEIELERAAFAAAFQHGSYTDADEVYWLAAEIDSKLEVTPDLATTWCDRLEAAAASAGFDSFKIWLIAPAGFSTEAAAVLSAREALGSARAQADHLKALLSGTLSEPGSSEIAANAKLYEIAIPMGDEAELIAAHTFEEIARRHGFKSHDVNQIKTALVEACINPSEHSHSPDRRINLQFSVRTGSVTITIANRGIRLTDAPKPAADSRRRGWGLKLIEKLMDEVRIEQTDDGSSLSMTKLLS